MLTKISLLVALCSGVTFQDVQKKVSELQKAMPGSQVSVRVDKKAACYRGSVIAGRDAKLLAELGK